MAPKLFFCLTLVLVLCFNGCSVQPLVPVRWYGHPHFTEIQHNEDLLKAVEHSLQYLDRLPVDATLHFSRSPISLQRIKESLISFREILLSHPSSQELNSQLKDHFQIYRAAGVSGFNPFKKMLVTGYYEPVIQGSLTREPPFLFPLYGVPPDLVIRNKNNTQKNKAIGRLDDNQFLPYWTRQEIETQDKCAGAELVWLKDPLDAFFLHVQGSGRILLTGGEIRGVHYKISNGMEYSSIGKYMVETNRITLKEASLQTIRSYINTHPQERNEILHHNQKYIFFEWTDNSGAIGNLGEVLTPGYSVAADQHIFPSGGLGFIKTRVPVVDDEHNITDWKTLQRFVLIQDKGAAIKGPGRIDIFWGHDPSAETIAGTMKEPGKFYLLLKK